MRNILIIACLLFCLFLYIRTRSLSYTMEVQHYQIMSIEQTLNRHQEVLDIQKHPDIDPFSVTICISTVRRNRTREYIYDTVDSLIPFMKNDHSIIIKILLVDVEQGGDGEYASQMVSRYNKNVVVHHMDSQTRSRLYQNLTKTCQLAQLYGDDLTRVIWRSKRVLDWVYSMDMAMTMGTDYVMILEDDTPVVGNLLEALQECHKDRQPKVVCRWNFWWTYVEAQRRIKIRQSYKTMYPQGNLQGVFALMMPLEEWKPICDWALQNFDKAPADWLIGRWLFRNDWRIALYSSTMAIYHKAARNMRDSSRVTISESLKKDPLFKDKGLSWSQCNITTSAHLPLHWFGGTGDLYVELPGIDVVGHDLGVPKDAALMDQAGHVIMCDKTPGCIAVNRNGWMKKHFDIESVSKRVSVKTQGIFVRLYRNGSNADGVKQFYDYCIKKIPKSKQP